MSHINPEHVITLQGQQYGTYRGVLDLAHSLGLEGIRTRILQVPGPDNDHVAIVEAEVRLKDGRVFVDVADASPKNVHSRMAVALIRMASTRAKGRALRDAVNIGEALAEELPDLETDQAFSPAGAPRVRESVAPARSAAPTRPAAHPVGDGNAPLPPAATPPRAAASSRVAAASPAGDGEASTAPVAALASTAPTPPPPVRPAPPTPAVEPAPQAAGDPGESVPAAGMPAPTDSRPAEMVCSSPECGRTVTQGQYNFSVTTYGAALCPACQRKRRAAQEKTS